MAWRRSGPPLHVMLVAIGETLGVKFKGNDAPASTGQPGEHEQPVPAGRPSIAEIAAQIARDGPPAFVPVEI